jgi:hypothetical protein
MARKVKLKVFSEFKRSVFYDELCRNDVTVLDSVDAGTH